MDIVEDDRKQLIECLVKRLISPYSYIFLLHAEILIEHGRFQPLRKLMIYIFLSIQQ